MGEYRIVAARPKGAASHLNTEFKVFIRKPDGWASIGWKSIHYVSDLLEAGHEVRTGKVGTTMTTGAPVELELRIARNDTKFKISEMPDE